jgi:hypothetical protein
LWSWWSQWEWMAASHWHSRWRWWSVTLWVTLTRLWPYITHCGFCFGVAGTDITTLKVLLCSFVCNFIDLSDLSWCWQMLLSLWYSSLESAESLKPKCLREGCNVNTSNLLWQTRILCNVGCVILKCKCANLCTTLRTSGLLWFGESHLQASNKDLVIDLSSSWNHLASDICAAG